MTLDGVPFAVQYCTYIKIPGVFLGEFNERKTVRSIYSATLF